MVGAREPEYERSEFGYHEYRCPKETGIRSANNRSTQLSVGAYKPWFSRLGWKISFSCGSIIICAAAGNVTDTTVSGELFGIITCSGIYKKIAQVMSGKHDAM